MKGEAWRRWGVHRVLEPMGCLPQAAARLDPTLPLQPEEILLRVTTLNIDSASFRQIVDDVGGSPDAVARRIEGIVRERGKMQNPVTGSGGMLLGEVVERGPAFDGDPALVPGAAVATLVSLTLTPLAIDAVHAVHMDREQVAVTGHAILWPTAPMVVLPSDVGAAAAVSVLDVAGAPAQMHRLVAPGMRVVIVGAGKSGLLCLAAARQVLGTSGRLVALDRAPGWLPEAQRVGMCDAWSVVDATDPVALADAAWAAMGGPADLVVNTANAPGTEMGCILAARQGGAVYFFNMATSFSRATLGAEGAGCDVTLLMGNGFVPGHASLALDLVRSTPLLRQVFRLDASSPAAP